MYCLLLVLRRWLGYTVSTQRPVLDHASPWKWAMGSTMANRGQSTAHRQGHAAPLALPPLLAAVHDTDSSTSAVHELPTHAGSVGAAFVPRNLLWEKLRARHSAAPPDGTAYFSVAIALLKPRSGRAAT
ncbi:hypothetical protein DFH06DRAFT_1141678 [Mycena polygramma]|nr:hypothetical protein DFH06DRAFT_1141678 [Mycena polygramma]